MWFSDVSPFQWMLIVAFGVFGTLATHGGIVSLIKQHRLSRRGWNEEAEEERLSMIFALPVGITLLTAVVMMLFWPTEFPTIINH